MTRVLKMIFVLNGTTTTATWTLADPKAGITKSEVATFMNNCITDSVVFKENAEATEIKDAYIYQTEKIELT